MVEKCLVCFVNGFTCLRFSQLTASWELVVCDDGYNLAHVPSCCKLKLKYRSINAMYWLYFSQHIGWSSDAILHLCHPSVLKMYLSVYWLWYAVVVCAGQCLDSWLVFINLLVKVCFIWCAELELDVNLHSTCLLDEYGTYTSSYTKIIQRFWVQYCLLHSCDPPW